MREIDFYAVAGAGPWTAAPGMTLTAQTGALAPHAGKFVASAEPAPSGWVWVEALEPIDFKEGVVIGLPADYPNPAPPSHGKTQLVPAAGPA